MITTVDKSPDIRAAHLIPSDVLVKVVPGLKDSVLDPITRLGQLYGLTGGDLQRKLNLYRNRISSDGTASDLLSASLLLLILRSFDEAIHFLERFLSRKPLDAYGWYALALASLKGRRPRLLTYGIASSVHKRLLKALELDPELTEAVLLLAVLTNDYFESKGFQVDPDLQTCLRCLRGRVLDRKEVLALLGLIPDVRSIPIMRAIQLAIL